MKKKKTAFQEKVDSDIWEQFKGLAKFKKLTRAVLLEIAMRNLIEKERGK